MTDQPFDIVPQKRFTAGTLSEVRVRSAGQGQAKTIQGHAAVFYDPDAAGTEYELFEGVTERIMGGAFDRALEEGDDARALFNHDPSLLLGRVSNGTVTLSKDQRGLHYSIEVDENDPDHLRVLPKIERGDLSGSSFGFVIERASWHEAERDDGTKAEYREVESVRLLDVSPVTFPAYGGTDVTLRAAGDPMGGVRESYEQWRQAKAKRRTGAGKWARLAFMPIPSRIG